MADSAFTVDEGGGSGGGAMSLIASANAVGQPSITFSGLSTSFALYQLVGVNLLPSVNSSILTLTMNGDTGNNYSYVFNYGKTNSSMAGVGQASTVAGIDLFQGMSNVESTDLNLLVYDPATASDQTGVTWAGQNVNDDTPRNLVNYTGAGHRFVVESVTSITLTLSSGTFTRGNFYLYGLAKP